jgi:hypothetical protein
MADAFGNIRVDGIEELLKDIDSYDAKTRAVIHNEIKAAVQTVVRNAKRLAPKDQGALAAGINYQEVKQTLFRYFSQQETSSYKEFGTRRKRKVPPEVLKLGFQLQATGKSGGTAEQALIFITAWVKRQGFRFQSAGTFKSGKKAGQNKPLTLEQTAYLVFRKIMMVGSNPQPYFFPPLLAEIPLLENRLQAIVNNTKI